MDIKDAFILFVFVGGTILCVARFIYWLKDKPW